MEINYTFYFFCSFEIRLTRDGKLDSWERAARFQFMDGMIKDDENEWVSCTKI